MTAVIILAAGESSRLGERKQSLIFKGKGLLQRTIDSAVAAECKPILVILGAYAKEIQDDINTENIIVYRNLEWQEGMSSSIRTGITILQSSLLPVSSAILMVCDQPFAGTSLLKKLINKRLETGKDIIACAYNDTVGVPVLFDKKFFPQLAALRGEEGAKKLIRQYPECLAEIEFPLGSLDIDTANDFQELLESEEI